MVSVYLDIDDSLLLKSKDKSFHVLFHIIRQADVEHNIWYADRHHKDIIMENMNISPNSLDKHINSLKERNLIIPQSKRGRYSISEQIFNF